VSAHALGRAPLRVLLLAASMLALAPRARAAAASEPGAGAAEGAPPGFSMAHAALQRGTQSAPAGADSLAEPVLVELRIGELAARTVPAYREGDRLLLPVAVLFELAEIRFQAVAPGRVEAALQPGGVPLVVDAARGVATVGRRRLTPAVGALAVHDGEAYAGTTLLDALLDVQTVVSWEELTAIVTDASPLPVARRAAREEARLALQTPPAAATPERALPIERPYVGGLVVDYALSAPFMGGGAVAHSLALGADVLGGSLEASRAAGGATVPVTEVSWTGVWRANRWLRQLRLGDALGTGPRPRFARGVALTNAPYVRPSFFGLAGIDGRLTPGWEIEAYRQGQLVAFDSVSAFGRFDLTLPVQYGDNAVDFVAYGPFGEVRQFNRNYYVLGDLLGAGRTEYGLSGGPCRGRTMCDATANADVRYGLSRRWTARAGSEWVRDSATGAHALPYLAIAGLPVGSLGVHAEAVTATLARGALSYQPSADARLLADYTRYAAGAVPALAPAGVRSAATLSLFARPLRSVERLTVEASADHVRGEAGTHAGARLAAAHQRADVRLQPHVRVQREAPAGAAPSTRGFAGMSAFVLPNARLGRVLGPALLRGTVEGGRRGLSQASAFLARPLPLGMRLDAGAAWMRGGAGAVWTATLSRDLSTVRAYTTVTAAPGAPPAGAQVVQGSAVWNGQRRALGFVPGPSVQRAGLSGRVFLDADADGRFGAGDEPLSGVTVRVGSSSAVSGAGGWFSLWDVAPFQPLPVTVDSMTLASPLWVPAGEVTVEPGPNRYAALDVPIVPGGVVEGVALLQTAAGTQPLGGARLVLVNRRTGERRPVTAFVDGEFSAIAVRPGEYQVEVERSTLERLEATAEPVRFTLVPSAEGATVSGVRVVLVPRPAPDGPPAPAVSPAASPTVPAVPAVPRGPAPP